MGIVIEKASILCSAFTVVALALGLGPVYALLVGVVTFIPVRMFIGGKVVSQTGIFASLAAVVAAVWLGAPLLNAFIIGTLAGYFYLYWWLFFFPIIIGK